MSPKIIIGIDTSNYTTSLAVLTLDGQLLANIKFPLKVKEGERGLRQSDAVFSHVKNIPEAMELLKEYTLGNEVVAVGVSKRPRNIDGSYMPCFLAGVSAAKSISAALGVPLYEFSHQCGHIMAAIYSSGRTDLFEGEFCAFHVSGGTTEMLSVKASDEGFAAELVGGTADLNAGQVIDRIGVHMGLAFPAGRELEALALLNDKKIPGRKPKLSGTEINLSGLENMAIKLYNDTGDKSLTAAFVFDYVGKALILLAEEYQNSHGNTRFLFAGGVMCNSIIKNMLKERFDASFAKPEMSADNAVGIAVLTKRAYDSEK